MRIEAYFKSWVDRFSTGALRLSSVRAAVVVLAVMVVGCGPSNTEPEPAQPEASVVFFGRSGSVVITAQGDVSSIPALTGSTQGGVTAKDAWLAVAPVEEGRRALVGIDVCTGSTVVDLPLGIPAGPNGLVLRRGEALAIDDEGSRLAVWETLLDGRSGLAVVGLEEDTLFAFLPGIRRMPAGIVFLASSSALPEGGTAVLGEPYGGSGRVFVVDAKGTTVASADAEKLWGMKDELWQILPRRDGSGLVVAGEHWVSGVRLPDLEREWTHERVGHGWVTDAGHARLLLTDGGIWPDDPASGMVYLMDISTGATDSIDVSTPLGGTPHTLTATVSLTAAVSTNGVHAFVVTGTARRGPTYPIQPPRVVVLNLTERRVMHVVDVSHLGLGPVALSKECR